MGKVFIAGLCLGYSNTVVDATIYVTPGLISLQLPFRVTMFALQSFVNHPVSTASQAPLDSEFHAVLYAAYQVVRVARV